MAGGLSSFFSAPSFAAFAKGRFDTMYRDI